MVLDLGTYQGRLLHLLNGYMQFMSNRARDDMIMTGEFRMPKQGQKAVQYIEASDMGIIFDAVDRMDGWHGSMCRGLV